MNRLKQDNYYGGIKVKQKIGFVGAGNLAEAVVKGLTNSQSPEIRMTDINPERLQRLQQVYGAIPSTLEQVVGQSDIIIIAVKPKDILDVLSEIQRVNYKGKLFISVAAGISLEVIENHLPGAAVVRIMPNTATAVLQSVTGMAKGSRVSEEQAEAAAGIFATVGKVLWLEERKMNAVTAISGSGPAYYYLFTELLMKAGIELGLTEEEAEVLVRQTIIGAGHMMASSGKTPARLREEVTSPNGTTFAAVRVFEEAGLEGIMLKAADAAAKRAEEMEREYAR